MTKVLHAHSLIYSFIYVFLLENIAQCERCVSQIGVLTSLQEVLIYQTQTLIP